jgi:hypothetical protein
LDQLRFVTQDPWRTLNRYIRHAGRH